MSARLDIWTVYDHPTDWPDFFVARRWELDQPTGDFVLDLDLDRLRTWLEDKGLVCFARDDSDDPKIVETWL